MVYFKLGERQGERYSIIQSVTQATTVYPAYPIERSVIELTVKFGQSNVQLPNSRQSNKIERSITEQSTIILNRTFNYQTPVCLYCGHFEQCTAPLMSPAWFTYQETDLEQNRIGLSSILFDCVRLVWKSNSQQSRCSILFDYWTQSNDCCLIGFDFVRFYTPGVYVTDWITSFSITSIAFYEHFLWPLAKF